MSKKTKTRKPAIPLGSAKARRGTPALKAEHRSRLAAAVRTMRANGGFTPTQDFRAAKTYAGTPHTFDAYMDRIEARAAKLVA
jgi:hypothetical protein